MPNKPTIVIHAGGANSRFFPLNTETNKGFLSLLGKPLVVRALESIQEHGFTDVVLVVSEKDLDGRGLSGILKDYPLTLSITWALQPEALGQGHALLSAAEHFSGPCIVMSPYYTHAGELAEKLWTAQQEHNSECVFMGTKVATPSLYGMLEFDPQHPNRVVGIIEKPQEKSPSEYKANSIYLLSEKFISYLKETPLEEYSLETALTGYCKIATATWIENNEELPSLKFAWNLFEMAAHLFSAETTRISPQAQISKTALIDDSTGPIIIEDGARVGDYAKILGPCYVGKNALVGDYCFVRNGCVIEADATVGANTEVVRSLIFSKASIHFGYLGDSILGTGAKVGAGLITANRRFDRALVRTQVKGVAVTMQSKSHGVIIGAHTHLGIGVRTMPGVLIGAHTQVAPGTVVSRNIDHGTTKTVETTH